MNVANNDENEECRVLKALRSTPEIFAQIAASSDRELGLQTTLRRQYPDDVVRAALTLDELRRRAVGKFRHAASMWFDRKGLEQSTAEAVSNHKARRFQGNVWDLCCGIGGDSIALASHCNVTSIDLNAAACLRTQWNAEIYGVQDRVQTLCQDVLSLGDLDGFVHIDPDRRPGSGGRVSRIEDYVPGLDDLRDLMKRCRGGAIKVSPASNFGGKFLDTEVELISLNGECKEATIWFGELAGDAIFRATVLPSGESIAGHPLQVAVPVVPIGKYLFDPDPAVVRAGLVDVLADRLGLSRLDAAEEYLTADELVQSPFVQAFEILENLPNNERDLKAWLRSSRVGQLEIKCRHIPIQADSLRRRMALTGDQDAVAVFARLTGKARIICSRRVN